MLGRNTPIMGAAASAAGGKAVPSVANDAAPASFKTSRLLVDGSCDIASSLRDAAGSSRTVAAVYSDRLRLQPPCASQRPVARLHGLGVDVHLAAHLAEFLRHLRHAAFLFVQRGGVVAHVLGDLHGAEFWAAHGAEV